MVYADALVRQGKPFCNFHGGAIAIGIRIVAVRMILHQQAPICPSRLFYTRPGFDLEILKRPADVVRYRTLSPGLRFPSWIVTEIEFSVQK